MDFMSAHPATAAAAAEEAKRVLCVYTQLYRQKRPKVQQGRPLLFPPLYVLQSGPPTELCKQQQQCAIA